MTGAKLAAAAESLVGTSFRLHGRDPANGLDCIGVVTVAFALCGRNTPIPRGYGIRNTGIAQWLVFAEKAGMAEVREAGQPGDLILVRPGPGQHHLLVELARERFVHAHAGLRRVVVQPGPLPWPIERRWRLAEQDDRPWPR